MQSERVKHNEIWGLFVVTIDKNGISTSEMKPKQE